MSEDTSPQDDAGGTARRAESDATAELERLAGLYDAPLVSAEDLVQHPPELDYFEAELSSLRSALRGANAEIEDPKNS